MVFQNLYDYILFFLRGTVGIAIGVAASAIQQNKENNREFNCYYFDLFSDEIVC